MVQIGRGEWEGSQSATLGSPRGVGRSREAHGWASVSGGGRLRQHATEGTKILRCAQNDGGGGRGAGDRAGEVPGLKSRNTNTLAAWVRLRRASPGGPGSHRPAGFGDPVLQEAAVPPMQAEACGTRGSGTGWEPVPPGRARGDRALAVPGLKSRNTNTGRPHPCSRRGRLRGYGRGERSKILRFRLRQYYSAK